MTSDPAFLYLTLANREALASMTYSILNRKGVVVLTGDAGTGKTTLIRRVFQSIPWTRVRFSAVLNPTLTPAEFLELVLLDFGITDVPASKAQRLILLQQFLIEECQERQVAVLVVDEAHKLPLGVLDEIWLLTNFQLATAQQLQILMAGQTELGDMLNRHDLCQLKQRVAVRLVLHRLSATDVDQYIQHRWQTAGASGPHPFQHDMVARIAQCSQGIPRLVNALCENALMLAYAKGHATIGAALIDQIVRDLDLLEERGSSALATPKPPPGAEREQNIPSVYGHLNGTANRAEPLLRLRLSKHSDRRNQPSPVPTTKRIFGDLNPPNREITR